MDIESFVVNIKTEEIYVNIAKVVETRLDTSSYQVDRPLSKGKNVVVGLTKDESSRKIIKDFAVWRPKSYSYLTENKDECKNSKRHKKMCSENIN